MYYLSVLAQFKNETMTLKLWLDHHLWQGVQHFYLIDNGSTDHPMSILQPYIRQGLVSYFHRSQPCSQVANYRSVFAKHIWSRTFWLAVVDIDEFLFGVDGTLVRYLRQMHSVYLIYLHWLVFGTSGCVDHPVDIRRSNVHRHPLPDPVNTKYIVQAWTITDPSSQLWIHWIIHPGHSRIMHATGERVRLHHYVLQSEEFFRKVKCKRGDATRPGHKWNSTLFKLHNDPATLVDETLKRLVEIKREETQKKNELNVGGLVSFIQSNPVQSNLNESDESDQLG